MKQVGVKAPLAVFLLLLAAAGATYVSSDFFSAPRENEFESLLDRAVEDPDAEETQLVSDRDHEDAINPKQILTNPSTSNIDRKAAFASNLAYNLLSAWEGTISTPWDDMKTKSFYSDAASGAVLLDGGNRVMFLGFRGTKKAVDVAADLTTTRISCAIGGKTIKNTHMGFCLTWSALRPQVMKTVQSWFNTGNFDQIVVTGHSLGGAVAQLAAASLYVDYKSKVKLVTFGTPRAGGQEVIDALPPSDSRKSFINGLCYEGGTTVEDPVTNIPKSLTIGFSWREFNPQTKLCCQKKMVLAVGLVSSALCHPMSNYGVAMGMDWPPSWNKK